MRDAMSNGEHCLVALVVRNVYGVPFEVTLTRSEAARESGETNEGTNVEDGDTLQSTRLIPPGASER